MLETLQRRLVGIPGVAGLWSRFPFGSLPTRVDYGIWHRSRYVPYLFGVHRAARLAAALGHPRISCLEFGVAGGNGLVALEEIAAAVSADTGVLIEVAGFDSGAGMPAPRDYRDLPHVWEAGFYKMDLEALRRRLKTTTRLCIGDVRDTVPQLLADNVAPVGFVSFDLDFYSSTAEALRLFRAPHTALLPRVYCYFDDVVWPEFACHSEFTGELRAIEEYNGLSATRKIAQLRMLRWMLPRQARWQEQIYIHHAFDHPEYAFNVMPSGAAFRELPLGT